MKSKLIFVPQFAVAAGILFGGNALYAQYGQSAPKQPTGATAPARAQQEPYQPDNPFFRKPASPAASAAATTGATKLSAKDKKFFSDAASSGGWEIATGRVAEQKAEGSAAKEIAARMIADYSKRNKELVDLGKKKGLQISTDAVKAQQISGEGYDKRYLNLVVKDHEEDVGVFEKEAKSGDDAEIRNWAAKNLPATKQRLAAAKNALNNAK